MYASAVRAAQKRNWSCNRFPVHSPGCTTFGFIVVYWKDKTRQEAGRERERREAMALAIREY